jgi:hypothetical protein
MPLAGIISARFLRADMTKKETSKQESSLVIHFSRNFDNSQLFFPI